MPAPAFGQSREGLHIRPYRDSDLEPLMEIMRRRYAEWYPDVANPVLFGPDDPTMIACVVITDDQDRPVAAIGARRLAEIGTIVDDERLTIHQIRDLMLPAWVKLGGHLIRSGFKSVFARVTSPTPAWGRMLEKRAGFFKSPAPHYYFSLEALAERVKPR